MNKKQKSLNNKGFSLVELIVVIAIMAILVGALAPQLTKYIEKAKRSSDVQAAGTIYTAVQMALADPDIEQPTLPHAASAVTAITSATGTDEFQPAIAETVGGTANLSPTYKSAAFTGTTAKVAIDSNGNVTLT
ncbi:MAG TPA: type II secretion system protein, partial [Lachnospiraceae bacterium]|nr:type II secretion system protein [Lachnospiraceae bacterium]